MKIRLYSILTFYFALLTGCSGQMTTVQVTVVDDAGKPIENTSVEVGFSPVPPSRQGVSGRGVTNADGVFSFTGNGYVGFTAVANKTGYYESRVKGYINDYGPGGGGKPIDPKVTMVLRPIRNPVKMYYWRRLILPLPERNKATGLDLETGDWVAPLGKGTKSDIYLTLEEAQTDANNWTSRLVMSFPNPTDGIQSFPLLNDSMFKSPYEAPADGYLPIFNWEKGLKTIIQGNGFPRYEHKNDANVSLGFVIRLRSKTDSTGKIIEAHYGKLLRSPEVADQTAVERSINLEYVYLNPLLNSRNLEFKVGDALNQQKENLRPDLP